MRVGLASLTDVAVADHGGSQCRIPRERLLRMLASPEWNGYVLGGTVVPCVERKHDVGVATMCPVYLSRKAQSEAWSQRCRIYYIQVFGRFGP